MNVLEVLAGRFAYSPELRFFITLIEPDGHSVVLWDGSRRCDALSEAKELAASFNARIVDHTAPRPV